MICAGCGRLMDRTNAYNWHGAYICNHCDRRRRLRKSSNCFTRTHHRSKRLTV